MRLPRRAEILLDSLLILLCTAALIRPWWKAKYLDLWGSIESTFIADARFLIAHWPHPQWQPLWYTGTRFDYIYPPALRYGTALISMATGYLPVKAYHVYTAILYCIGVVGVYVLIRTGMESRAAAYLGAAAVALMSPSFLFLADLRWDSWNLAPQRLMGLVKWGEGPHISAVALLPFALAFAWRALDGRRPGILALAALLCAAVVSNNFYGATSLAILYPLLVWSAWITGGGRSILLPAIAIPLLAYGLTAFWLTPSYLQITTKNMKYVSHPGNGWSMWAGLLVIVIFMAASWWLAHGRRHRAWGVFVSGFVATFALIVLGHYYFNLRIYGEPHRLTPELDLALILGAAIVLHALWKRRGQIPRAAAAVGVIAAFATTFGYLGHCWSMFQLSGDYQQRIEYRASEWVFKNMPDSRVYAIGSVRLWFDTWHDLTQMGGGSEQGVSNDVVELAQWEVPLGKDPQLAVLWLQCLGVDAVFVSGKNSEEFYHDFTNPKKFEGVLQPIFDDGKENLIYRVPRRYLPRVRVVETARLNTLKSPALTEYDDDLQAYFEVIEHGPDSPASLEPIATDGMRVKAKLAQGQSIVIQESYDPSWEAWSAGHRIAIRKDALGFMAIDAPPGDQEITLAFATPFENRAGRVVTAITGLVLLGLFFAAFRLAK